MRLSGADPAKIVAPVAQPAQAPTEPPSAPPQPAQTAFRTLATVTLPVCIDRYPTSRYALVELHPQTGRRHQLRRHLKHISHPIIGDATHGKGRHIRWFAEHFGVGRLLLAATALDVPHPMTGERLALCCPPSADFGQVLQGLGWADVLPAALQPPPLLLPLSLP